MKGSAPQRGLEIRSCIGCGTGFQPYRDSQITCSRKCRDRTQDRNPRRNFRPLTCADCGSSFEGVWSGLGRQPACPACVLRKRQANQERKNNARRGTNRVRRDSMKYRLKQYGLTIEQYEQMVVDQGGRCAICGEPPNPRGILASASLNVDHSHETGRVRGLLCTTCNQGLGYFKDDEVRLLAAVRYLKETN